MRGRPQDELGIVLALRRHGGSLAWDGHDDFRAEQATDRPVPDSPFLRVAEPVPVPPLSEADRIGGHAGVIRDFVAAVQGGGRPETAGEDNIRSLAMVFGAIESAVSGRRVPITIPALDVGQGKDAAAQ